MTGRTFAVASGKGGVGKTTTAVNLAAAATEAGRSVVLVDYDLGMANLGDVLDVEASTPTLHDVLAGDADALDAPREAPTGFDAVVGGTAIEDFGRADPAELRGVVDELREEYDVVVVDTGGGLTHDTTVPLGVADDVVLVSTPTAAAVENTGKTAALVERLGGTVRGVVVTRVGGGGQVDASSVAADLDADVLGTVPEDRAVPESAAAGEPTLSFAPDSPAGQAYRELGHELLGEAVPLSFRDDEADAAPGAVVAGELGGGPDGLAPGGDNAEREHGGDSRREDAEDEGEGDAADDASDRGRDSGDESAGDGDDRSLVSKLTGGLLG